MSRSNNYLYFVYLNSLPGFYSVCPEKGTGKKYPPCTYDTYKIMIEILPLHKRHKVTLDHNATILACFDFLSFTDATDKGPGRGNAIGCF